MQSRTRNNTIELQQQLGSYCRTGANPPKSSIDENIVQYRRLVFNVISDTINRAFPIAIHLVGEDRWNQLVTRFFEEHTCSTAQVWKLPLEFIQFYSDNETFIVEISPLLPELLLFEWLEIEVYMMEDMTIPNYVIEGDLTYDMLIANPEIRIQSLHYPIHKKKVTLITESDKGNYFVSIHRDINSKQVHFNELSLPMVEILIHLNEAPASFQSLCSIVGKYLPDGNEAKKACIDLINFGRKNGLILGYQDLDK